MPVYDPEKAKQYAVRDSGFEPDVPPEDQWGTDQVVNGTPLRLRSESVGRPLGLEQRPRLRVPKSLKDAINNFPILRRGRVELEPRVQRQRTWVIEEPYFVFPRIIGSEI